MKVAIIGAAGAGKSALARKVATSLKKDYNVKVVDNTVQELVKKTGYAYDLFAAYPQNFQIVLSRWTKEQEAEHKGAEIVVSVGSIYETILWASMYAAQGRFKENYEAHIQAKAAITALGMIESLIGLEYNFIFFLPYSEKRLKEKGESYDTIVNRELPSIVEGQFKRVEILKPGKDRENVTHVSELIRRAIIESQVETSEDDGQAVRGGGGDPQQGPQEEEPMSDMRRESIRYSAWDT